VHLLCQIAQPTPARRVLRQPHRLFADTGAGTTILFPLLGAGEGGGDVPSTARTLIHAAVNYLRAAPTTRIGTVLFLAYTDVELDACLDALDEVKDLQAVPASTREGHAV
jgi:hypothetical protein